MQAVLVTFKADGERRSFSLPKEVTVIGRREDCDLRIPLGEVSRKHCRFIIDGDTLKVEDLGSSNGTFHNGERIQQETLIQAGDTIQVGPVVFVIQIDGVPADDEIQAPPPSEPAAGGEEAPPEIPDSETMTNNPDDVVDLALEEVEEVEENPQEPPATR